MYDTYVTIVGNVLTRPELRRTKNTGSLVAHFKVASTARRLDRETGQWVDGNSLRVRVNCWRKLAEGVVASLITGDPVMVVGRLYTRDWTDENDNHRIGYELEAVAVGHDLSRGQGTFTRNRPALSTSAVEDEPGTVRIGGEQTDPVPADQVPARRGDRELEDLEPARPVGLGGGYGDVAGGAAGDELLGEEDDLGATDDLGAGLSDESTGPFPASTDSFSEAATGSLPAAGATGDFAGGADGPGAGNDESGGGTDSAEDRRGRGRRRGRTAVPV
jgi:single-strand DNA-binding protein